MEQDTESAAESWLVSSALITLRQLPLSPRSGIVG
jgi:hypothetical protein